MRGASLGRLFVEPAAQLSLLEASLRTCERLAGDGSIQPGSIPLAWPVGLPASASAATVAA